MYIGMNLPDRKEWRKNIWWHLKQLIRSYKIWRKYAVSGMDFGTFHCWRVNLGWKERDKKIYK